MEGRLVCPLKRGGSVLHSSANLAGIVGNEYLFVDGDYGTNRFQVMKLVYNASTITVKAKKLVRYKLSATSLSSGESLPYGTTVDGYTIGVAEAFAGVTDDKLDTNGAAAASYFLIHVRGPALCTTSAVSGGGSSGPKDIAVGDKVVACTAAASTQTTDAGGVASRTDTASATTPQCNLIENAVGRAATARATTITGTDILVIVRDH